MMTHAPAPPVSAPAAPAPAAALPDAAVVGHFSQELAQLLFDEAGGDEAPALSPEALAALLGAMVDAPPAAAGGATRATSVGAEARQPAMQGAGAASPAPDAHAVLDGMLDEMRSGLLAGMRELANQAPHAPAMDMAAAPAAASATAPEVLAGALAMGEPGPALKSMAPPARHDPPLQAQVGSPDWGRELASRIVTIATDGLHSASVRLSPEHLGPLDIRIAVRDGEASVAFGASHADTRAALEQALPRLRELLAAQGLQLAEASVSEHAARQERAPAGTNHASADTAEEDPQQDPARHAPRPLGLLDLYA